MNEIEKKLDELAEIRAMLDVINMQKQDAIDGVLSPEIRAELEAIEAEFAEKTAGGFANAAAVEAEIKSLVINNGASVKGSRLHAVYSKPRVSWDTKKLDGMVALIPQIAEARKEGNPSVSIRVV